MAPGTLHPVGFWTPATGACSETGALSGTAGSPNVSTDFETTPVDAVSGWRWRTNGTVERIVSDNWTQFQDGTEYTDGQDSPACDWYVRATYESGDAPNGGSAALNTWLKVAGSGSFTRTWLWVEDSDPGTQANYSGIIKVEISNDASGSPVEATGYYRGNSTQFGTL